MINKKDLRMLSNNKESDRYNSVEWREFLQLLKKQ